MFTVIHKKLLLLNITENKIVFISKEKFESSMLLGATKN
jgi:hypothetical protein